MNGNTGPDNLQRDYSPFQAFDRIGLPVNLEVEFTGPAVILLCFCTEAKDILYLFKHGAVSYYLNFCCKSIILNVGDVKSTRQKPCLSVCPCVRPSI